MPFSDPMADGPAIQAASLRALKGGMTLTATLEIARNFRQRHPDMPLVLMGYYNPIYIYGNNRFIADALAAGVDGLIVVDLPPEEDSELCIPALDAGLNVIRLITPDRFRNDFRSRQNQEGEDRRKCTHPSLRQLSHQVASVGGSRRMGDGVQNQDRSQ